MKIQEPISHWNNFTVPELKNILKHCEALEKLGIAQDEEMVISIKRDIILREKRVDIHYVDSASKLPKIRRQLIKHNSGKTNKVVRKIKPQAIQQPQDFLLEQNA